VGKYSVSFPPPGGALLSLRRPFSQQRKLSCFTPPWEFAVYFLRLSGSPTIIRNPLIVNLLYTSSEWPDLTTHWSKSFHLGYSIVRRNIINRHTIVNPHWIFVRVCGHSFICSVSGLEIHDCGPVVGIVLREKAACARSSARKVHIQVHGWSESILFQVSCFLQKYITTYSANYLDDMFSILEI
jgi:hypothetical protein